MQPLDMPLSSAARKVRSHTAGRAAAGVLIASLFLAGCATRYEPAPIVDGTTLPIPGTSTPSSSNNSYMVQSGDTLYKIAQQHGVTVQELIRLNNITDPSQLRVGQVLALNSSHAPAIPASSTGGSTAVSTTPIAVPDGGAQAKVEEPKNDVKAPSSPRASDADLISWQWPANGKITQGFTNESKGIDIAGTIGDPVKAAASGKVMYAGNGVRGLGNLVLLGHSNGFITAYAHNDSLAVKMGDEVTKGQTIATLGQSDTNSPRLHFEIRRRGTPVNPMGYLPAR